MSGRTQRKKTPTSKGKEYSDARVSLKNKFSEREKTKNDMEELVRGMQTTDLGRPAEGARVEAAAAEGRMAPTGPVLQPATFVPRSAEDEGMEGLSSAMARTTMGGKRRRKNTRRRHKRRRRTSRR
jgi:hypothetical protein